ncbi:MAG: universal stress protein, partial [bacterium]
MIFHRILAATDGTEASLRGVEAAAQIAVRYQAEFILLTAVSVPQHVVLAANMDERTIEKYVERMAQEALGSATAALRHEGVGAEVKVVFGALPEIILAEI